jgi:hypothetical protein
VARTVGFTVDSHHHPVHATVTLTPAGQVTATVTGAADSARGWLETTAGTIVRTGDVVDGKVRLGGLVPGKAYRLYVTTGSNGGTDGTYGEVDLTAKAGPQTTAIALDRTTITLKGHAANAPGGTLQVHSQGTTLPPLTRSEQRIASSGAYEVHGLIPGRYAVTVFDESYKRVVSRPKALTLTASPAVVSKDYAAGPKAGAYTARFVSGSAPVHTVLGDAVNGSGDEATVLSLGTAGKAVADSLWPGTYRYQPKTFVNGGNYDVPAVDGPWWFGGISSSFVIRAGSTTNDGTIALHVHASL